MSRDTRNSLLLALGGVSIAVAVGAAQGAARGSAAQALPVLSVFVYPTGSIVMAHTVPRARWALVGEFYVAISWDGRAETYPTREEIYAAVLESWWSRPATDSIKEAADASMVRDWRLNTSPPRGWKRGTHFEVEVDDPATWRIEVPLLDRRPILGGRVQAMLLSNFPKIRGPRPVELPPEWTPEIPLRRGSTSRDPHQQGLAQARRNRLAFARDYPDHLLSNIHQGGVVPASYLQGVPRLRAGDLVTVYRAVPPEVSELRPGDWVALERSWATQLGRGKILSQRVPASHVVWSGTDMNEWFYTPPGLL